MEKYYQYFYSAIISRARIFLKCQFFLQSKHFYRASISYELVILTMTSEYCLAFLYLIAFSVKMSFTRKKQNPLKGMFKILYLGVNGHSLTVSLSKM